jgi:hypothetical protein
MLTLDTEGNLITSELKETLHHDETTGGVNLFSNGGFEDGTSRNFHGSLIIDTDDPKFGKYCAKQAFYGSWQSSEMVPVDTSQEYVLSVWMKSVSRGSDNSVSRSYLGFACYDQFGNFIDLRDCGDIGNTRLSRELRPGDEYAYFESSSGWYTGRFEEVAANRSYYRHIIFFPPDHPYYGEPWKYSQLSGVCYEEMIQMPEGDWRVKLANYTGSSALVSSPRTMPDYGYPLPAGTPVSRGEAGGTYNYALGAPYASESGWYNHKTNPFSGERRNSGTPFRYGTTHVRFLILGNYWSSSSSIDPKPIFALDNIALTCVSNNQTNLTESSVSLNGKDVEVQEIIELGEAPVDNVLGYIDDATLYIANEIIEE